MGPGRAGGVGRGAGGGRRGGRGRGAAGRLQRGHLRRRGRGSPPPVSSSRSLSCEEVHIFILPSCCEACSCCSPDIMRTGSLSRQGQVLLIASFGGAHVQAARARRMTRHSGTAWCRWTSGRRGRMPQSWACAPPACARPTRCGTASCIPKSKPQTVEKSRIGRARRLPARGQRGAAHRRVSDCPVPQTPKQNCYKR